MSLKARAARAKRVTGRSAVVWDGVVVERDPLWDGRVGPKMSCGWGTDAPTEDPFQFLVEHYEEVREGKFFVDVVHQEADESMHFYTVKIYKLPEDAVPRDRPVGKV